MSTISKLAAVHPCYGWDNQLQPELTVEPGVEVEIELVEASGGQIHPDSSVEKVTALDFAKINPVTGPVYIKGAEPQDTLVVEILGFEGSQWGWTAIIPGFGLLADEFPKPFLHFSTYDQQWVHYTPEIRLPYRPFPGTIGVAPAETGLQSVVFPRNCGGNMDTHDLTIGSKLYLPVQVEGALFSTGDGHAAQGDGEVCGTGIETPTKMRVRFGLKKAEKLAYPRIETVREPAKTERFYITTGVAPDLMVAAKDAIRYMIDYLTKEYRLSAEMAYTLCSVAVDLRISEIVDAPNWIVTAHLNQTIFI
ncbi:MAG TPA: acetamidase [Firmicutes bacterium]|jgi:acetamidase/formamidase|nr:acetamidase [Bacillota bacterium]